MTMMNNKKIYAVRKNLAQFGCSPKYVYSDFNTNKKIVSRIVVSEQRQDLSSTLVSMSDTSSIYRAWGKYNK
jgi:ribosomal protein L18